MIDEKLIDPFPNGDWPVFRDSTRDGEEYEIRVRRTGKALESVKCICETYVQLAPSDHYYTVNFRSPEELQTFIDMLLTAKNDAWPKMKTAYYGSISGP